MPERRTRVAAIYTNGFRAVAVRKMVIEKTPHRIFIDPAEFAGIDVEAFRVGSSHSCFGRTRAAACRKIL
jgi:hypothetical protein